MSAQQDTGREESLGAIEPYSTTWSEEAQNNRALMKVVIKKMVENKANIPMEVLALVNTILNIFSGLMELKDHRRKFARLLADASALVAIIWKLEVCGSQSRLEYIPALNQTMSSLYKLLITKTKRGFVKQKICILLDLAKLRKYQGRINSVAADLMRNMNITQILLDVITDGGVIDMVKCEVQGDEGKSFGKKRKQEYDRKISEDELGENTCPEEDSSDKTSVEQPKPKRTSHLKKLEIRYTAEPEAEDENTQGTPRQVSWSPQTARHKREQVDTRGKEEVVARAVPAKSQPGTRKSRTNPPGRSESRSSISGFQFTNGAGTMNNHDVGTIRG